MKDLPAMPVESDLAIGTERLELIPILADDARILFPILSDPRLYEFTGETPPASVDALCELYAYRETCRSPDGSELWFNWTIRIRDSGVAIGYMQATVSSTHADVAWVVGLQWQGSGYASEAAGGIIKRLRSMGVTRILARIHPRHVASQQVAINAGLLRTGDVCDGEDVWILSVG